MSGILGAVALGSAVAGGVASTAGKYIDAMNAPDQLRSVGSIDLAKLANADKAFVERWKVDDYAVVADTYERTGYRVDRLFADYDGRLCDFIKDNLWVRHYFNPVQISEANIISAVNIPSAMLDDIRMRLRNGLRFWNVSDWDAMTSITENGKYDNVEEDYIQ